MPGIDVLFEVAVLEAPRTVFGSNFNPTTGLRAQEGKDDTWVERLAGLSTPVRLSLRNGSKACAYICKTDVAYVVLTHGSAQSAKMPLRGRNKRVIE